jgi:RNA polymerase sigma-70 factor (ECF subfamily)
MKAMTIVLPKNRVRRGRTASAATPARRSRWISPKPPAIPGAVPHRRGTNPANCETLLDDAAWIQRIQRGDESAARALVERLRPTVLKCIRRRLPRWIDEEDLMQNVFAKIFSHLHQFSGSVPLEHWVSRIAINTSLNQIDYEAVRPEMRMSDLSEEQEAVLQNRATGEEDTQEKNYAREIIELLLAQLRPDERLIVTLLHIEQRSTHEISQMTGLSISLVKVKAFRTRHKMQRLGRRLMRENGQGPLQPA